MAVCARRSDRLTLREAGTIRGVDGAGTGTGLTCDGAPWDKDRRMDDIKALEARITDAFDRIRYHIEMQPKAEEQSSLRAQLEEERLANAQLEERVKLLKERQDGRVADLEAQVAGHGAQMAALDGEMQRLRASNADLRDLVAQLRAVASDGAADPDLINQAMAAEIEALAAQRASEAAEVDAILTELKPLLQKEG